MKEELRYQYIDSAFLSNSENDPTRDVNQVCPRCKGKGHLDTQDIKRFMANVYCFLAMARIHGRGPGPCAYCDGTGKVDMHKLENFSSDDIAPDNAVGIVFKNVFEKFGTVLDSLNVNVNKGIRDLLSKIEKLPADQKADIEAEIAKAYADSRLMDDVLVNSFKTYVWEAAERMTKISREKIRDEVLVLFSKENKSKYDINYYSKIEILEILCEKFEISDSVERHNLFRVINIIIEES